VARAHREEVVKKGEEPPGDVDGHHQREQHRAARPRTTCLRAPRQGVPAAARACMRRPGRRGRAPAPKEPPRHPAGQHRVQRLPRPKQSLSATVGCRRRACRARARRPHLPQATKKLLQSAARAGRTSRGVVCRAWRDLSVRPSSDLSSRSAGSISLSPDAVCASPPPSAARPASPGRGCTVGRN